MNRIQDVSCSFNGVKFNNSGISGKFIFLVLGQMGNLPIFRFESQLVQIHSILFTLFKPVTQDLHLLASHFTTEDLYHNWSQQVQMYSGPHLNVTVK